ncbi:SET domain containing protein [Novymonas esmeraldas]|uniref:SET domain containing protein n=1 Tax=Novymonas esmeraldas TaxID=1808958 RepID=A0AAW0ETL1_9TRYP
MASPTAAHCGSAWMARCMRDVKAAKLEQVVRPYASGGGATSDTVPVRTLVATARVHRGERLGTIARDAVLTGERAAQLLRHACRGQPSDVRAGVLQPLAAQRYDDVVARLSALPSATAATPPHLLLSRDAVLATIALYLTRSPLNAGAVPADDPLRAWADALPRRPPPMGALLRRGFLLGDDAAAAAPPLPRRLRLGQRTRAVSPGEDLAAASTELMVQAVDSGEVELADLRQPEVEVVLSPTVLANYYKGRTSALTQRQLESQRARDGTAAAEAGALALFLSWERQLQTHLVDAMLPTLLLSSSSSTSTSAAAAEVLRDTPAWQAEESALRWAHFMTRSRAVNANWRRRGPPLLSVVPFVDMLNHTSAATAAANVVYEVQDGGDVSVTASRTIEAGEELVLRYGHVGQRGCLFGDEPRALRHTAREERDGRLAKAAAVERDVRRIERRHRWEMYAEDEDDNDGGSDGAAHCSTGTTDTSSTAAVAHREMAQEVAWLWRFGFLRTAEEKNGEAALLWSRGLRSRIAHLTDVRRKGRPGEFVVGVPEGLRHLREQRAQLERDRYSNQRVFPPQQV